MSEVWGATDTDLGRRVALKLLAPDEDIARFEHEARTFAALGHSNVTQVYDYGQADGRPFRAGGDNVLRVTMASCGATRDGMKIGCRPVDVGCAWCHEPV